MYLAMFLIFDAKFIYLSKETDHFFESLSVGSVHATGHSYIYVFSFLLNILYQAERRNSFPCACVTNFCSRHHLYMTLERLGAITIAIEDASRIKAA